MSGAGYRHLRRAVPLKGPQRRSSFGDGETSSSFWRPDPSQMDFGPLLFQATPSFALAFSPVSISKRIACERFKPFVRANAANARFMSDGKANDIIGAVSRSAPPFRRPTRSCSKVVISKA
jgi:hypothetical protein